MARRKQRVESDTGIEPETTSERAFEFVRDALDDPAVLEKLPERATLTIPPVESRDPGTHYAASTRRFAITAVERPSGVDA